MLIPWLHGCQNPSAELEPLCGTGLAKDDPLERVIVLATLLVRLKREAVLDGYGRAVVVDVDLGEIGNVDQTTLPGVDVLGVGVDAHLH